MEEEDEFGDLYTDVISNFPSSAPPPPPPPPSAAVLPPPSIDLNLEAPAAVSVADVNLNFKNIINNQHENQNPQKQEEEEEVVMVEASIHDELNTNNWGGSQPKPINGAGIVTGGGQWGSSDSDSDDDLQIVLNDTNPSTHHQQYPNAGFDDDDDDGEGLIIVADDAAAHQQQPNLDGDQDWCDDSAPQPPENNNNNNNNKQQPNQSVSPAPSNSKLPFTPYHAFPSQFKYVRPGAAGGPGGAPAQVRPPLNSGGRGRGGRGFHPGFWPPNAPPPRSLDFTLPSHKTIFEVDIDSFEEKPWKYPGVDVSDFFNFSLNEETWKDYCKQLEQLRLESTMQSKIRVYESGRTEQEYDPDLPPELAAAAGNYDSSAQNADIAKADLGDPSKGSTRVRMPLPTGRAIQVELGCGERLPSADTRPPRLRDSDAVIEIVLQGSADDESAGNGTTEHPDSESEREDEQVDVVDEDIAQDGDEYSDTVKENVSSKRSPVLNSLHADNDQEGERSSPRGTSSDYHPDSKDRMSAENVGSPCEERSKKESARERSPHMSSGESAFDRRSREYQREESVDSMEHGVSPASVSLAHGEDALEASVEGKATDDDVPADVKSEKGKADMATSTDTSKNKRKIHSTKPQKPSNRVDSSTNKEDGVDVKPSKSSDNSKATGSSREHHKRREGMDEEVVQNGRSTHMGDVKRHRVEGGHDSRRKDRDGRVEMDRNYSSSKGREEYYPSKEWDPYASNQFHLKSEGVDRKRERVYSEGSWPRRDEDPHGRRVRPEDARKQERADDMVSRHRGKVREFDRSDKEEYLHSRKFLDNGSWRGYHEKDGGLRYREKDDGLKTRHEILDDHHGKRRKEDDYMRRDHVDKEDISLGHRESSSTRGKRERDGSLNQRKRDDLPRIRDSYDDLHAARVKDEIWMQRERAEQQRDRDEWYRAKQSYEESMSRRERDEARAPVRSSRTVEEKVWVGQSHGRDEYKGHDKDGGRHSESLKRRDRVVEEISFQHRGSEDVHARGSHFVSEGKRPRQERSAARNDRAVNASDDQKFYEKKHKDNLKKAREADGHNISVPSKKHQGEKGLANDMGKVKGMSEKAVPGHDTSVHNTSKEGKDDGSSDDDQQGSKRGRSKLERWTSHKDRDIDTNSRPSSSLKLKETGKDRNAGPGSSTGVRGEHAKDAEAEDGNQSSVPGQENEGSESKDVDVKPADDRHLDTVEKLKRRSERFKLPLAGEKDPQAIKKIESEPLPSQNETPTNAEVKQERPPRKRRWVTS